MPPANERDLIPTRRTLLSRLKNWDDKDSWRDFFNTYWKLLYNFAARSGLSEAEAQDVVQETIIAVANKMPGFKYDPAVGAFKGWLLHITRWKIADQIRKRQRADRDHLQPPQGGTEPLYVDGDPAFERMWDDEWERNLTYAALERVKQKVSPKHYQIYDLSVLKKWPVEKIVALMNVNRNQIYLARSRLSELFEQELKTLVNEQRASR